MPSLFVGLRKFFCLELIFLQSAGFKPAWGNPTGLSKLVCQVGFMFIVNKEIYSFLQ